MIGTILPAHERDRQDSRLESLNQTTDIRQSGGSPRERTRMGVFLREMTFQGLRFARLDTVFVLGPFRKHRDQLTNALSAREIFRIKRPGTA